MPLPGRQIRLGWCSPNSSQGDDDRQSHVSRQIFSLIESALTTSGRMKRNRHGQISMGENVRPTRLHQRAERLRQRPSAVVLERVNDRSKRPVVRADSARTVNRAGQPPATRAPRERQTDDAPRR
jgi:hypothetical protein